MGALLNKVIFRISHDLLFPWVYLISLRRLYFGSSQKIYLAETFYSAHRPVIWLERVRAWENSPKKYLSNAEVLSWNPGEVESKSTIWMQTGRKPGDKPACCRYYGTIGRETENLVEKWGWDGRQQGEEIFCIGASCPWLSGYKNWSHIPAFKIFSSLPPLRIPSSLDFIC